MAGAEHSAGGEDHDDDNNHAVIHNHSSDELQLMDQIDDAAMLVGMDERDVKRERRKQSNRESARRSRLRKQAECELLQRENQLLRDEIQSLKDENAGLHKEVAHWKGEFESVSGRENEQPPGVKKEMPHVVAAAGVVVAAAAGDNVDNNGHGAGQG